MKNKFLFLFASAILFISVNTFAQKQDFTLVNKTGVVIHNIYITQHDSDTWGEDIMGKDVLLDGEETDISFHPIENACFWDLKIDDADGNSITWDKIDLCKWVKITLHWDGTNATATFE